MNDDDVGVVLGCLAFLRHNGMNREQAIPYYERLLEHHKLVPEDVNKNAMRLTLEGRVASYDQAIQHIKTLFPDLVVDL